MKKEILLGLTTTKGSDWRQKITDIDEFVIKKISLFLTGLSGEDRKELYHLLESTQLEEITHIHLRTDMELWELDYLVKNYQTRAFNLHPACDYPWEYDYSKYREMIFVENISLVVGSVPLESELNQFAGLCVDFAHLENRRLRYAGQDDKEVDDLLKLMAKYPIGCCHVSAITKEPTSAKHREGISVMYDSHTFADLSEFDYLKKYEKYLPEYISLELENSFAEQFNVKEYLERLMS